jgi:hypothetical protein
VNGFTIRPSRFRKVQGDIAQQATLGQTDVVEAIVKVKEPGYVPPGVTVRAQIGTQMMTGELPTDILDRLEADPKVEAVSIGRRLRVIE